MKNLVSKFLKDPSGAVTVDWVVLTAAIVGLAIAVLLAVGGGVTDLSTLIADTVSGYEIATY